MKKTIRLCITLIFLATLMCCFVGCNATTKDTTPKNFISAENEIDFEAAGFEAIYITQSETYAGKHENHLDAKNYMTDIYLREKLTDVIYIWRTSGAFGQSYWTSGMTVMLDPKTGGPLTYENWLQYLEDAKPKCPGCNKVFTEDNIPEYCPACGTATAQTPTNPIQTCPNCNREFADHASIEQWATEANGTMEEKGTTKTEEQCRAPTEPSP